jgi:hypothetical protein
MNRFIAFPKVAADVRRLKLLLGSIDWFEPPYVGCYT